jgi:alkaline phosphatase D
MAGDVTADQALIWSRANKPSRMLVSWGTTEASRGANRILGPHCLESTDFTGRLNLTGLPPDQTIFYEVAFADLANRDRVGEAARGSFRTAPAKRRDIKFCWSGDTAGQGWGIDEARGGMRIYETMRKLQPDFFLHSGDTIYADSPIERTVKLADGTEWRNIVTEEKSKVAETLAEFRGNHKYNLLDANLRRFHAEVPQVWQWDDHEVTNNWSDSKSVANDPRYKEKSVPLLVARGAQAFHEYAPIRRSVDETERVYRRIGYGPLLDLFVIDMRSYRGPNGPNLQEVEGPETAFLGKPQIQWLLQGLRNSKATWKVIAADMPIGLLVPDGPNRWEAIAQGNGPALGRELEIAAVLGGIHQARVKNVVWLTADTHYTGAHHYSPDRAKGFKQFTPFWEFMSGPLHSGTFGPNATDDTFGIEVRYQKPGTRPNMSPAEGFQFFGEVAISAATGAMTVTLRDVAGTALHTEVLKAA